MDIENAMADSGKTYGGHKLFKTSVGLVLHSIYCKTLVCIFNKTTISDSGFIYWRYHTTKIPVDHHRPDLQHIGCDNAMRYDRFWAIGGVVHDLTIEFYTDTDFNLQQTGRIIVQ